MAIDFNAIRSKLNQLSGVNSKRRSMWRPQEGEESTVRIIGFTDNDGNPFKERWFYYNIGDNPGLLTPNQFGKIDPIQELINKLKEEGTPEAYEMAKKLYPKMRVYASVIVRGEEDEGVKLWAFGKMVYQNLLNIIMDPDYGDITDVYEGHDVRVTCTKLPGRQFATTEVRARPKPTELGTKTQIKEWAANVPNLDDMYSLKSYDELENIINAWLTGGEDNTETSRNISDNASKTETVHNPPNTKTNNSTSDSSKKKEAFDSLDDAFADLEKEIPY